MLSPFFYSFVVVKKQKGLTIILWTARLLGSAVIAFLLFTSSSVNHEYYVSVTKIEYVKKEKSLQIISQIFIDDFGGFNLFGKSDEDANYLQSIVFGLEPE